nr:RNA-directed DNA polymerase, eukaryota [Tanacetum cinerariifolium]
MGVFSREKRNVFVVSSFRRDLRRGAESSQLNNLLSMLDSVLLSNSVDRWSCDLNGEGTFCFKDFRNLLDEFFLPKSESSTRWIKSIPIKVNIFAWRVSIDRLATWHNLVCRGVSVPFVNCPMGCIEQEDLDHFLFRCELASGLSNLVCRWWNQDWIQFDSYQAWLAWFKAIRMPSSSKGVLEGVFYISWWSILNYRNNLLFAVKKPRKDTLFDDIVLRSFNWCNARRKCTFHWDSWMQHPRLISCNF